MMWKIGNFARYILAGTIGKVINVERFDGKVWAQLDNGLYYDTDYLEPVSESEFKERKEREEYGEKETSKMDERLEKLLKKEEIEFKGEVCGAG